MVNQANHCCKGPLGRLLQWNTVFSVSLQVPDIEKDLNKSAEWINDYIIQWVNETISICPQFHGLTCKLESEGEAFLSFVLFIYQSLTKSCWFYLWNRSWIKTSFYPHYNVTSPRSHCLSPVLLQKLLDWPNFPSAISSPDKSFKYASYFVWCLQEAL